MHILDFGIYVFAKKYIYIWEEQIFHINLLSVIQCHPFKLLIILHCSFFSPTVGPFFPKYLRFICIFEMKHFCQLKMTEIRMNLKAAPSI